MTEDAKQVKGVLPPGAMWFSYQDASKVSELLSHLREELSLLRSSYKSSTLISILRRLGINLDDHHPLPESPLIPRHRGRHECHIGTNDHLFVLTYTVGLSTKRESYTTFATSEEHARGLVEDKVVREDGSLESPNFIKIRDYGTQPIAWCIDWTERMIDDVERKFRSVQQRIKDEGMRDAV